jgi:hypothetical protein
MDDWQGLAGKGWKLLDVEEVSSRRREISTLPQPRLQPGGLPR